MRRTKSGHPLAIDRTEKPCMEDNMYSQTKKNLWAVLLAGCLLPISWASAASADKCRAHLTPITKILETKNYNLFYPINDEIPNVIGKPLGEIAKQSPEHKYAQSFVEGVKNTLNKCQSQCQGVKFTNGKAINCQELSGFNLNRLRYKLGKIDDEAKVATPSNSARCAFDPTAEGCEQANADRNEDSKKEETKKDKTKDADESVYADQNSIRPLSSQEQAELEAIYWQHANQVQDEMRRQNAERQRSFF